MNARTMIVLSLAAASVLACRQEDRPSTTTLAGGDSVAGDSVLLITRENEIAVDTEPALVVIARTVRGPYSLHPTVFSETRRYVEANYPTWLEFCLGIYPQDPDAVPADSLTWDVAFPIAVASTDPSERSELLRRFSAPQAPYELRIIEGGTVATLRTNVKRASLDGLSMYRWMTESGYVQTSPTRMEFLADASDPTLVPTRIVMPITERGRGLRLDGEAETPGQGR